MPNVSLFFIFITCCPCSGSILSLYEHASDDDSADTHRERETERKRGGEGAAAAVGRTGVADGYVGPGVYQGFRGDAVPTDEMDQRPPSELYNLVSPLMFCAGYRRCSPT